MRVVVVGASGNVGTALLRALRDEGTVTGVVGIARRVPTTVPPAPYDIARWAQVDLGAQGPDGPVVDQLVHAFIGADAVVLLSWALQPTHQRDVRRRTNVDGARRAIQAVVQAGVPHLVVASSVGAYSPADDDVPHGEDWPTDGVRSSDYSVDKVAVERLLDEAQVLHPDLRIARVQPALIFQRGAGSAIERYFLGPALPAAALRWPLPVLPWPRGFRLQAVHADDVAQVYRAIVTGRYAGAFNVAAPDVLRGPEVASVVSRGRCLEVPVGAARAAVTVGWSLRAVAVSPGWVDLAQAVPLLDTARVRADLGWQPRWTAVEALADLVHGMAHGSGTASPPMRPRRRASRSLVGGQTSVR